MWIWIILACVVGVMAYIRLAPTEAARWHVPVAALEDADQAGGVIRIIRGDLAALDQVIRRSGAQIVAGDLDSGHITYVSRTKWMGFPDYTTVQVDGDVIKLWGRLRFGQSDIGVNKRRVEGWIAQLR